MLQSATPAGSTQPPTLFRGRLDTLTFKLTLAFLCIGLLGAVLVALFVGLRTQLAFNQFVVDRGRNMLLADLARYYQQQHSWEGVGELLTTMPSDQAEGRRPPPVVLADATGTVVVGDERHATGSRISMSEREYGQPISVSGTVVGWLLNNPGGQRAGPGSPEADFLSRFTHAIIFSAVGATAMALLLGLLLARTLTQPLRELTSATQAVAQGALGQQVTVRSRDEIGTLAASFNQMSADLARASTLRQQMTADIAHDLRTPLSVILGYTEALRDGKLDPAQDIFDTMHIEAQHLQHLIDDLRTLSLADAGELPLTRLPLAPQSLLERAAAAYRAQAQERNITLQIQHAPSVPQIEVDPERMAQVLGNLLSNALRYTPAGGTITLRDESNAGRVRLMVSDTGAGIAPEAIPHIFERFYRVDPSRQQQNGSSGLGLAIARSLVEAHNGTLTAQSTLGQGTTFMITLPALTSA